MEINAQLSPSGAPILEEMEWNVRERDNVKVSLDVQGRPPIKTEGRLFLTTERLVFANKTTEGFRSFSIPFNFIGSLNYKKLGRNRKQITFSTPDNEVSVELLLTGVDLKTLIGTFFSMYHHNRATSFAN